MQFLMIAANIMIQDSPKNRTAWVEVQLSSLTSEMLSPSSPSDCYVDFYTFKTWAITQVDIYKVLAVFNIVPAPFDEHERIS